MPPLAFVTVALVAASPPLNCAAPVDAVAACSEAGGVAAVHAAFGKALVAGDAAAIGRLYSPDAISLAEFQPALHGSERISRYWGAVAGRIDVLAYAPVQDELIDLGDGTLVEIGRFTLRWRAPGTAEREEEGKFVAVYKRIGSGLRLISDVRGYFRPLDDAALFSVPMEPPPVAANSIDPALAAELKLLNDRNAQAIRTYDTEAKVAQYAQDAIFWPFADTPKRGIDAIRAHLTPYTERSRGVSFDSVRVWHDRATRHGNWVLENSRFHVRWAGGSQQVSGGGLRLWRRESDGSLRMFRQVGTHDYRP